MNTIICLSPSSIVVIPSVAVVSTIRNVEVVCIPVRSSVAQRSDC